MVFKVLLDWTFTCVRAVIHLSQPTEDLSPGSRGCHGYVVQSLKASLVCHGADSPVGRSSTQNNQHVCDAW